MRWVCHLINTSLLWDSFHFWSVDNKCWRMASFFEKLILVWQFIFEHRFSYGPCLFIYKYTIKQYSGPGKQIIWIISYCHAPIPTKVICFSRLLKCLRSLYSKQHGPRSDCSYRAVCSGSTLFASILDLPVMLGNYLQQTTSADYILRCIFFLAL